MGIGKLGREFISFPKMIETEFHKKFFIQSQNPILK
jgi:hypothetical protein